jgi:uncharacterized protein with ParB-like and HNH nuclease domain
MIDEYNISENGDSDDTLETELLPPLPRYRVSSFGTDFDVEGLIRRLERGDIFIPDFQRAYVWKPSQASQFIESILLGLPVPGIMLAIDEDASEEGKAKRYVVDGLQRLTTLQSFIAKKFPDEKIFKLTEVQEEFLGKTFDDLSEGDKRIILDYVIHATVIKQEKPDKDKSGIYSVFRRLNTNGTPLTPQEIRSAIYQGKFSELLEELTQIEAWRDIFPTGRRGVRKENEELILRFLALYNQHKEYQKPLETFLNQFMSKHKNESEEFLNKQRTLFVNTISLVHKSIGNDAFRIVISVRRQFNRAAYDSIMIGLATRLEKGDIKDFNKLNEYYNDLIANQEYIKLVTGSTTDENNMRDRIKLAINTFANLD